MRLRPPLLFTSVYGAGLATGLLHLMTPVGVIAVVVFAGFLMRRHSLLMLLGVAALLGRLSGELAWARETGSCAARLPPGRIHLAVRLLEPADSAGGRLQ